MEQPREIKRRPSYRRQTLYPYQMTVLLPAEAGRRLERIAEAADQGRATIAREALLEGLAKVAGRYRKTPGRTPGAKA